ncbi:HIT family protein [Natrinema caseinilyticum]|uniref:HIT family protein n=1 Tax=Natrinema caseinilyticum TaxID=2961570 RepID=UPI0020C48147|nr:HIT domain-containing protein [Natrinema caseinilyticum]
MESLFAPWRMDWVTRDSNSDFDDCVFCTLPSLGADREHRILARNERSYVVLNKSPYTPGHLLVLPEGHVSSIPEMEHDVMMDVMTVLSKSIDVLDKALHPEGYNIGMNIGEAGGASVQDHLHVHIVPRWTSDTTFMPTTANTKVVAEALDETYDRLYEEFSEAEGVESDGANSAVIIR